MNPFRLVNVINEMTNLTISHSQVSIVVHCLVFMNLDLVLV